MSENNTRERAKDRDFPNNTNKMPRSSREEWGLCDGEGRHVRGSGKSSDGNGHLSIFLREKQEWSLGEGGVQELETNGSEQGWKKQCRP